MDRREFLKGAIAIGAAFAIPVGRQIEAAAGVYAGPIAIDTGHIGKALLSVRYPNGTWALIGEVKSLLTERRDTHFMDVEPFDGVVIPLDAHDFRVNLLAEAGLNIEWSNLSAPYRGRASAWTQRRAPNLTGA